MEKAHLVLIGPPGVGKLTVGKLLSSYTKFPLYDNAKSVDTASLLYPYGTAEFRDYRDELRMTFYTHAIRSEISGLISTCCLARNSWVYLSNAEQLFHNSGWTTKYILLNAGSDTLISRARSKERSNKNVIMEASEIHRWLRENWPPNIPSDKEATEIDTSGCEAGEVAKLITRSLEIRS